MTSTDRPKSSPEPSALSREESEKPESVSCRGKAAVVEIVADGAPRINPEPQLSMLWPQYIQSKAVIPIQFQEISINDVIRFGIRFATQNPPIESGSYRSLLLNFIAPWGNHRYKIDHSAARALRRACASDCFQWVVMALI